MQSDADLDDDKDQDYYADADSHHSNYDCANPYANSTTVWNLHCDRGPRLRRTKDDQRRLYCHTDGQHNIELFLWQRKWGNWHTFHL